MSDLLATTRRLASGVFLLVERVLLLAGEMAAVLTRHQALFESADRPCKERPPANCHDDKVGAHDIRYRAQLRYDGLLAICHGSDQSRSTNNKTQKK